MGSVNSYFTFIVVCVVTVLSLLSSVHVVEERHVGVYYRGGALLPEVTQPGYHLMLPFITQHYDVNISFQTDNVTDVTCVTSDGVKIEFSYIEVVNILNVTNVLSTVKRFGLDYDQPFVYERVRDQVSQKCSIYTLHEIYIELFDKMDEMMMKQLQTYCDEYNTGVDVVTVRFLKPTIPLKIAQLYQSLIEERLALQVSVRQGEYQKQQAENRKQVELVEAERQYALAIANTKLQTDTSLLDEERKTAVKRAEQERAMIDQDTANREHQLNANATRYRMHAEAQGYAALLTPEYIQYQQTLAVGKNMKTVYFGPSLPHVWYAPPGVSHAA